MQLTYKFRLHDTAHSELRRQSRVVNTIWNYCNEAQREAVKRYRLGGLGGWLSGCDLQKLTAGSSKELDVHAHTIKEVCVVYARSRAAKKKPWLKWRVSNPKSPKRLLGWVPFNTGHVVYRDGSFVFRGRQYRAWISRDLSEGQTFGAGSFSQDSQGHWFINLPVEVDDLKSKGRDAIGIDLGLKDIAVISTGKKIEHPKWYRKMEPRIALAQRANKTRQVKKLHAKVRGQRNDHLHKVSTRLVQSHAAIFVGNVNAAGLAKTNMARSVFDAGWSTFRTQLAYKAIRHRVVQCSECWCIPDSSPRGVSMLGIREWTCSICLAVHDRDMSSARVILARGLTSLEAGAHHG
jgi:putative transposase